MFFVVHIIFADNVIVFNIKTICSKEWNILRLIRQKLIRLETKTAPTIYQRVLRTIIAPDLFQIINEIATKLTEHIVFLYYARSTGNL